MATAPVSFDYIIVGAGSAGCVLANRLSADPRDRVLLIEAGGSHENFFMRMPLGFLRAMLNPRVNWNYMSEPEPALGGRQLWLPRGRLLGGSSVINGMFYMRGHSRDFDGWRDLGCEGWSYADVLPYFKRMEASWRGAGRYHGADGPLAVVPIDTRRLLHEPLMATARAAGFATTDDINGEVEEGFARGEVNIDGHGRRASTAHAYLHPVRSRANLTVVTDALVTRVVIQQGRAVGVEYLERGAAQRASAVREVIISGGTFNSPQLLMLSGVGPAAELERHGIKPLADLPGVGGNLSEHMRVPIEFAARGPVTFLNELRADRVVRSVLRWIFFGTGAFATQINSCNVVIRTQSQLDRPDVQLMCNPVRMDARIWWPLVGARQEHRLTADVVLLHPLSRGRVTLRSANPSDPPRVALNLFAHAEEFVTARRGIETVRRIYATDPQAQLVDHETAPGAQLRSPDELDAYIRRSASVTQHPVGTCAMGRGPQAVVDPELKVRGVEGLRVADASIMPTVPGGNTNGATIMIGERAADLVLGRSLPPEHVRPTSIRS
jgi:choline dehydrogenase